MKNLFLIAALGAALVASPAMVKAQGYSGIGVYVSKINVEKIKSNIAKSDAEIADAKKNTKSATWIKRGNVFVDADSKAVNGLYPGIDVQDLALAIPDAIVTDEAVSGVPFQIYDSGQAKIYVNMNGLVEFFVPTVVIDADALDKAYDAFDRAYTMDPKAAGKVKNGMIEIQTKAKQDGDIAYNYLEDMDLAAKSFRRAFRASMHPSYHTPDTLSLYIAGTAATRAGNYAAAIEDLNRLLELKYYSEGEIFYLKAVAQYQLGQKEESLATMQQGMDLFPANENIIKLILAYYADEGKDPSELVSVVLAAIENNPSNAKLYDGLARAYDALGRHDEAIETIKKAVALSPGDWVPQYLEGIYTYNKAVVMSKEAADRSLRLSHSENLAAKAAIDEVYKAAIDALEKAYAIDPTRAQIVGKLKEFTFLLRDDPAMQAKYDKYDEMFKNM
jgi:tetratricopeptide (TPR) repeat protein